MMYVLYHIFHKSQIRLLPLKKLAQLLSWSKGQKRGRERLEEPIELNKQLTNHGKQKSSSVKDPRWVRLPGKQE